MLINRKMNIFIKKYFNQIIYIYIIVSEINSKPNVYKNIIEKILTFITQLTRISLSFCV